VLDISKYQMGPLHISRVLQSKSHHSWVNFYSGEWETTGNIVFVFSFAPTAKEKIHKEIDYSWKNQ